jgi:membrane fusion protein (multidrug efflux system)
VQDPGCAAAAPPGRGSAAGAPRPKDTTSTETSMRFPRKRILVPVVAILVIAGTVGVLSHFDVIALPGSTAQADDGGNSKKDKKKDDEPENVPVPVELARVDERPLAAYYRASSVLEADRHVELVAKVSGRVQRILVEEGDWVREGQVLAELENDRERVQLRQAELKVEEEQRELTRREALLEKHLVTEEQFEATRGSHDLATTDRDLAKIALDETLIKAPFDGQVTARKIVPGQHVNAFEPLVTLVDFEPLRVRIHLPESIARRVSAGDRVLVSPESADDPIPAIVERVAPVVDPATSTVRLTLLVQGARGKALVGGFVKVRVTTDSKTEALSIPKLALVEEGGLRSVFVAEGDSARKVEIRTGLSDEDAIEVLEGVRRGDYVVTMGQGGLRSGSKLEVLNAELVGWTPPPQDSTKAAEIADGKKKSKKKSSR